MTCDVFRFNNGCDLEVYLNSSLVNSFMSRQVEVQISLPFNPILQLTTLIAQSLCYIAKLKRLKRY